ncbi:MAG: YaaR family protein [Clostridium sp.]
MKRGIINRERGDILDIRVDNMQQVNATTQTQQAQQSGEDFKFTLMSSIEEAGLSERLSVMMQEITMQGEKLGKHMDVRDMKHYRRLIQEFMNEIVNRSHKFSRENFLDRRGRHRVYGMIKRVNVVLDELAGELIKEEKDTLAILSKVDEIRGLLLDIIT